MDTIEYVRIFLSILVPTTLRINQLQKESTKTGTKTMQVGGFLQYNLINHIIL